MWCRRSIDAQRTQWWRDFKSCHHLCLIFSTAILLAAACGRDKPRVVTPAFYHWQTTFDLTQSERIYLDSLGCKRLYVKVLDIGRDPATSEIQPYSRAEWADTTGLYRFDIVPAVFITNEVFQNIPAEKIEWLAGKVAEAIAGNGPERPGEIQFDCDWTASTRDAFFLFLRKMKERLPESTRLSATIRLHQYKFPEKTGVPPVSRGMLMFYNTGDIENPDAVNSIFQPEDARKYLSGAPKHYALPLDLALPVFSWALVYREGALWKIIPDMPDNELVDTLRFEKISNLHAAFRIRKGTFIAGHYLRPGDLLRVEAIAPDLLREAAGLAATADLADQTTVAFFHLDTAMVRRYPVQLLDSVCKVISLYKKT